MRIFKCKKDSVFLKPICDVFSRNELKFIRITLNSIADEVQFKHISHGSGCTLKKDKYVSIN